MDTQLPAISANEFEQRATGFANHLVAELEGINVKHPDAKIAPELREALEKAFGGAPPNPSRAQFVPIFK